MQRTDPFYTMTLFLPILMLTILSPVGLILPGWFHRIWAISYHIASRVLNSKYKFFPDSIIFALK